MCRNYREEAETAQLQGILSSVIVEKKDGNTRISLRGPRKIGDLYADMIDNMKKQERNQQSVDRMVLMAKTTSNRTRRRSKEALERRREKYFSKKAKGRDTVTVFIQGDSK